MSPRVKVVFPDAESPAIPTRIGRGIIGSWCGEASVRPRPSRAGLARIIRSRGSSRFRGVIEHYLLLNVDHVFSRPGPRIRRGGARLMPRPVILGVVGDSA